MDPKISTEFINQITALREMSKQYKKDIESLTNSADVMTLQDEMGTVAELIIETTEVLKEIRDASLKKSRQLLSTVMNHPRYDEMDKKLGDLGYGGRKTRKHRRKSRR
jgi:hypothetical protein